MKEFQIPDKIRSECEEACQLCSEAWEKAHLPSRTNGPVEQAIALAEYLRAELRRAKAETKLNTYINRILDAEEKGKK